MLDIDRLELISPTPRTASAWTSSLPQEAGLDSAAFYGGSDRNSGLNGHTCEYESVPYPSELPCYDQNYPGEPWTATDALNLQDWPQEPIWDDRTGDFVDDPWSGSADQFWQHEDSGAMPSFSDPTEASTVHPNCATAGNSLRIEAACAIGSVEAADGSSFRTRFTRRQISVLRIWLGANLHDPFPDPVVKATLAAQSGLSVQQVERWFARTRARKLPRLTLHRQNAGEQNVGRNVNGVTPDVEANLQIETTPVLVKRSQFDVDDELDEQKSSCPRASIHITNSPSAELSLQNDESALCHDIRPATDVCGQFGSKSTSSPAEETLLEHSSSVQVLIASPAPVSTLEKYENDSGLYSHHGTRSSVPTSLAFDQFNQGDEDERLELSLVERWLAKLPPCFDTLPDSPSRTFTHGDFFLPPYHGKERTGISPHEMDGQPTPWLPEPADGMDFVPDPSRGMNSDIGRDATRTPDIGPRGRRGVLPSPCPNCDKKFRHAKHLKRHMLTHTGYRRPFKCVLCNDTFSRVHIFDRHIQKCSVRRGNPSGASYLSNPAARLEEDKENMRRVKASLAARHPRAHSEAGSEGAQSAASAGSCSSYTTFGPRKGRKVAYDSESPQLPANAFSESPASPSPFSGASFVPTGNDYYSQAYESSLEDAFSGTKGYYYLKRRPSVSPRELMLDEHDIDETAMPLFRNLQTFHSIQSSFDPLGWGSYIYNGGSAAPVPQQYPFVGQQAQVSVSESTSDFPAHLISMESVADEEQMPSSQPSHEQRSDERPADRPYQSKEPERQGQKSDRSTPAVDSPDPDAYVCAFCGKKFTKPWKWIRHEESVHAPSVAWVCSRQLVLHLMPTERTFDWDSERKLRACWDKPEHERTFFREDLLLQHLRGTHKFRSLAQSDLRNCPSKYPLKVPLSMLRCPVCDDESATWDLRCQHVKARHYSKGEPPRTRIPALPFSQFERVPTPDMMDVPPPMLRCPVCDEESATWAIRCQHIKVQHYSKGEPPRTRIQALPFSQFERIPTPDKMDVS